MDINAFYDSLKWEPVSDFNNKLSYEQQLFRIRHSTSHIMASAILKVIGHAEFATGPATGKGFFYDFKIVKKVYEQDLPLIEEKMAEIVNEKHPFEFAYIKKEDAYILFRQLNQLLKLEILDKIQAEMVTLYRVGDYVDLCAGPHVSHSGNCQAFKLLNVSAAHWKKEDLPSLTRITGTAWEDKKKLRIYLEFLQEMSKRDHRVLGPQLELFSFHQWAAAALWQPKGVTLRKTMVDFWHSVIFNEEKYVEISNPILYKKELFQCSGHWDHFNDDMFVIKDKAGEVDFIMKPMNCPDTMLFFGSKIRSYRDLPLRVAEGQVLHRNEPAGALHGIMRSRNFNQDDAHIFLTNEHLEEEIGDLLGMIDMVYGVFGLSYDIALSTRPEKYMGEIERWNTAEDILKDVLSRSGKTFKIDEGEGAFYGPKIDITIKDSLGRSWQCGTVQLDFQLPIRFDLNFINSVGEAERPIVIHRAVFGSFERFIGILIEHFGGSFPTWLSPVQVEILPINDSHLEYAQSIKNQLKKEKIRVVVDQSNESLNYKIRKAETNKSPYILIIGDKEVESGTVNIRRYGGGRPGSKTIEELISELRTKVDERTLDVVVKDFSALLSQLPETKVEEKSY